MFSLTKQQFAEWLEDSKVIKLTKFNKAGKLLEDCDWRYHFRITHYGLTMVNEHSETFHILNDNMVECFGNGVQVWATYKADVVLVYTRIEG